MFDYNYLFITSAILCLLYFIGFFKFEKAYKIFTVYITGALLLDYVSSNLWQWFKIYNVFTFHFYDLFQFIILSYFYTYLLKTKAQLYTIYGILIFLPLLLISRYIINPNLFFEYSLLETYLTTIPIIIYSTMHLYNGIGGKSQYYYINLGLLFYLFTSTFIFLLFKLIDVLKINEFNSAMYNINIVLQYFKFGFFFYQLKVIYFAKNE